MSLAQRVRDFRYSKGWGPDELASRAEISRTALYQIESGKTGLPRAGTLRRIAVALDVPMEELLDHESPVEPDHAPADHPPVQPQPPHRPNRPFFGWLPSEGGPLTLPSGSHFGGATMAVPEESRFAVDAPLRGKTSSPESAFAREGELMHKLHELLHSPLGQ